MTQDYMHELYDKVMSIREWVEQIYDYLDEQDEAKYATNLKFRDNLGDFSEAIDKLWDEIDSLENENLTPIEKHLIMSNMRVCNKLYKSVKAPGIAILKRPPY